MQGQKPNLICFRIYPIRFISVTPTLHFPQSFSKEEESLVKDLKIHKAPGNNVPKHLSASPLPCASYSNFRFRAEKSGIPIRSYL